MSRFSILKKHLSFKEAASFYFKMKTGNWSNFKLKKLRHPFVLRDNPYDFATLEEVLLKEEYHIDLTFEPLTIIDGGANIGLTSIYFANKYPGAEIVSVEPEAGNFEMLRKNTRHYPNVSLLNTGIWDHNAHLKIVDTGRGNNSFTVEELAFPIKDSIRAISVGDIMSEKKWKTIDILKLDIEGSEKNVFEKNYERWLPLVKVLIIELHDRLISGCSETVFKSLANYNFAKEVKGENNIFINKDLQ
jgi:FkbM family methyltransferase